MHILRAAFTSMLAAATLVCAAQTTQPLAATAGRVPAFRGTDGTPAKWEAVVAAAGKADVIIIGEEHTDAIGHLAQLALYRDILARQPHAALSLEFLERNEQPLIDRYLAGALPLDDFIRETSSSDVAGKGSWKRFYQPLVDAAAASGARVIGSNTPRLFAKLAREKGYDALKALPAADQSSFTLPITSPTRRERERFLEQMRQAARSHGAPTTVTVTDADAAPFLRSQELWNATMSQSIVNAHDAGAPKVVQIIGSFHVDEFGGIVRELKARAPGLKVVTVLLDPDAKGRVRGRATYVLKTTPPNTGADSRPTSATGQGVRTDKATSIAVELPSAARLNNDVPVYELALRLSPADHRLEGSARILLPEATDTVQLRLHPDAALRDVAAAGAKVTALETHRRSPDDKSGSDYTVRLEPTVSRPELLVSWDATYHQDPAAGEAAGEIHNFAMNASIGDEGVFLTGPWYPQLADAGSSRYQARINTLPGLPLVASGAKDTATSSSADSDTWFTPYPVDEFVIAGGPHKVNVDHWRGIDIELHLKPSQEKQAEGLLSAVKRYLARYEAILGPLPTRQYRIVDNFFSSGFAFPGFTLLSSPVIDMGEVSQTGHGFIDHEFVHTWFGCGIPVDEATGNWCEALTSYCTNHYGFVLDGDPAGARKYRRDASHAFSKLSPQQDAALASFGNKPDTSRIIGYNKGAVVFHMLEQQIGQQAFQDALRQLNYQRVGRITSWEDLRHLFEETSGQNLDWFFRQWVRSPGAPELRLQKAAWNAGTKSLHLTLAEPSQFRLQLPVDILDAGTSSTVRAELAAGSSEVTVPNVADKPLSVTLDSGYDVFRRVSAGEIIPTLDVTRRSPRIVALVEDAETSALSPYIALFQEPPARDAYRQAAKTSGTELVLTTGTSVAVPTIGESSVAILGNAARSVAGQSILTGVQSPVRFLPGGGFSVGGRSYTEAGQAVLATVRHPSVAGRAVTLIYGNSPDSYPKASNLPFYPNSVVVFNNRRPVDRQDLELPAEVAVQTVK